MLFRSSRKKEANSMKPVQDRVIVSIETKDNVQKIGSVWAVEYQRKDNYDNFDPTTGVVEDGEHRGKLAFFHKLAYKQALRGQNKAYFEDGDKKFLVLESDDVYFYYHNGIIEMVEDWTLCEPVDESWEVIADRGSVFLAKKLPSGLYVGKTDQTKEEIVEARLTHINPKIAEELGLAVGDVIYLDKASDIPLENELNKILDKKYFRVNIDNIIGIKLVDL